MDIGYSNSFGMSVTLNFTQRTMDQTVLTELAQNPLSSKYSWDINIRPVLKKALEDFEFNDLVFYLEDFTSTPFTIQRISELLLRPHTDDRSKYKRALEKCLKVTSSITPEKVDDMMEL
jgi:hypothetical protein